MQALQIALISRIATLLIPPVFDTVAEQQPSGPFCATRKLFKCGFLYAEKPRTALVFLERIDNMSSLKAFKRFKIENTTPDHIRISSWLLKLSCYLLTIGRIGGFEKIALKDCSGLDRLIVNRNDAESTLPILYVFLISPRFRLHNNFFYRLR